MTLPHTERNYRRISIRNAAEMFAEEKKQKGAMPVSKFMTKLFADAKAEGEFSALYRMVKKGLLSLKQAADDLNMSVDEF